MDAPLVSCSGCERTWRSPTMAEGLRTVGVCPRCSGALVFSDAAPAAEAAPTMGDSATAAPHLVLGLPRR